MDKLLVFAKKVFFKPFINTNTLLPNKIVYRYIKLFYLFYRYKKLSEHLVGRRGNVKTQPVKITNLRPYIHDNTENSGRIGGKYIFQDTWVARKIFKKSPKKHVDIGSSKMFLIMASILTEVISVDIRPIITELNNITTNIGDLFNLPFQDGSIESISSLSVIEHVGLGRYGDKLDPYGTEKAAKELSRVLKKGSDLYVSVPIEAKSTVYFNAHRTHSPEDFIALFPECKLIEEKYVIKDAYLSRREYDKIGCHYAYGLYHFRK